MTALCYGRQMVEQAGASPGDAETNVAAARAQFVSSLGRRLEALRLALATVEQNPRSAAQRDHLRRRIHAFGAAAGVLGFDRVFEAFREAEGAIGRSALSDDSDLAFVARTLDLVPSLVLGADVSVARGRGAGATAPVERRTGSWPTSVLVFAAEALAESLVQAGAADGGSTLELERTEDPDRAEQIVRVMAPDVAVVDADRRGARELMETLVYDPLLDPVRIIAIGTFDRPEAAATLVALGVARVLPKPVSPDTLKRSVVEVSRERAHPAPHSEPIGDETIESLTDRLAQELRRGLVDAVKAQSRGLTVSFGEGTDVLAALWASVARVRELVTLRSGGAVRFDSTGPEGAVPLAPWMGDGEQRVLPPGERRGREDVTLVGRTIVVADDDPAVAWFLVGLFRAAGADAFEAHDGTRALELVREKWPDLVVSDILMPGIDGFTLCREIKRDVVLADTPVILLSWKEDLLQRVRELGIEADGYLRKEAAASVVVQRVREVLLPRARVEARITATSEARGRLDGLTPRLVLELAAKRAGDVRVTIRDAGFLYEAHIRGGRLRSVSRTAVDGRSERGERVLSALLGVRAGRFAIQPDKTECPSEFTGELREALAPTVLRARGALRALAELGRVGRIDVDMQAFEPYAAATPEPARDIVRRFADGESPDGVVASGVPSRLVESVLADVVRHGAIRRIVGRDGTELFPKGLEELEGARSRGPAVLRVATGAPPRPEVPALRAVPSPARVVDEARTAPKEAAAPPPSIPKSLLPLAGTDEASKEIAELETGPSARPPVATTATVKVGEPARLPLPARRDTPGSVARVGEALEAVAPAEARPVPKGEDKKPEEPMDAEQAFLSLLSDSIVPPPASEAGGSELARPLSGKLAPPTSAPREPSPLEAALRSHLSTSGMKAVEATPLETAATQVVVPAIEVQEPEDKKAVVPRPERWPTPVDAPAVDLASAVVKGVTETPAPSKSVPTRPSATAEPQVQSPRAPPSAGEGRPEATEAAALEAERGPKVVEPVGLGVVRTEVLAAVSAPELARTETLPAQAIPEGERTQVSASQNTAPVEPDSRRSPEASPAASPSTTTRASGPSGTTPAAGRASRSSPRSESRTSAEPTRSGGQLFGVVVALVLAAVVGFKAMSAVRRLLDPTVVARSSPAPAEAIAVDKLVPVPSKVVAPQVSAPLSAAPPAASDRAAVTPAEAPYVAEDLELPADVAVLPDRGLLEMNVSAPHSIYIDGVFIGRGPTRRIPLREGPHEVRVRGEGVDAVQSILVRKGRRVRLEPANTK